MDLLNYLLGWYRGRNNWLIRNSPGRPELIRLDPKCYMENNVYMKEYKNDYHLKGHLN